MFCVLLAACGDGNVDILECTGECTCDADTNTCSCLGGTDCTVDAEDHVTLICEGNARCALECDSCDVQCPGTSGCDAVIGDGSTGECFGTADCDFHCTGDCEVQCGSNTICTVTCGVEEAPAELCPDYLYVCGTACPA